MQMQPDVTRHHQDAVAGGIFVAVAEDGLPRLRFSDLPFNFLPVELCHRVSAGALGLLHTQPRTRRHQTKTTPILRWTLRPKKPQAPAALLISRSLSNNLAFSQPACPP